MRKRISKRMMKLCAVILSILITFSQSGVLAYAEELVGEENTEPVIAAEEENAESETAAEEENAEPVIAAEEEDAENENASEEGFEYTQAVDGVEIFVSAPKGVFPKGTTLQITKVDDDVQKEIDESIDEVREVKNVVASYTFDITFFNEDGEEIEPDTEQGKVSVFFNLAEAGNDMNDVSVYHTYENGDELETEVIENVNVETEDGVVECEELEGFSYYTVEFTYGGELRYVLNGDGEVELAVILEACELSDKGDVTAAVSSNEELFKAENRDSVWYVVSLKAFDTEESLVVTMGGYDYTIVVTDEPESGTYDDLRTVIQNAILNAQSWGYPDTTVTLESDYIGGGTGDVIDISGLNVTINLNGHTIDRGLTEATYNGCVFKVGNGKTLKIMDDSGNQGIITGGYSDSYGGGIYVDGGTLKLENGIITNNKVSGWINGGAGVYVRDGHFIMTGGKISNNESSDSWFGASGGGVVVGGNSSFEMTGGIITGNTIGGNNAKGGGVYIYLSNGNNATIGASAQITGNTCDSKSDNLFVGSPIEFTQDFADDANIGISTQSTLLNFSVNAPKGKEGAVVSDNPSEYIVEKYTDAGVEKVRLAPKKLNFKELQEKINTTSEGETIVLNSDCNYDATNTGEPVNIKIDKNISIDLNGHTIDRKLAGASAVENGCIFMVEDNKAFTIKNGTLTGGNNTLFGGAIKVGYDASLTADNVTFRNNVTGSGYDGGAISCSYGSKLTAMNCTFSDNVGGRHSGAICMAGTEASLSRCTFSGNKSTCDGGAITMQAGSTVTISGCEFTGNKAGYSGGAVYSEGESESNPDICNIENCTFKSNEADTGGAVYAWNNSELTANECVFTGNSAQSSGAAITNYNSNITLNNVEISSNKSDRGALYIATNGWGATKTSLKGKVTVDGNTKSGSSDAADIYMMSPKGVLDVTSLSADSKIGIADVSVYPKSEETVISSELPSGYTDGQVFATKDGCKVVIKDNKLVWVTTAPKPDDEEETESSSSDEPAPVVPMAETGLTVARYVGNSKIAVPFITGNAGKAGWGTINGLVAAHKATNGNTPLNVTMNGYATVDNELLKNVCSQKVDLALNLDNNVTVVVPKQNNVILSALSVAGANNSNVFFRVSSLTQKNVPEVAGHTTGLNFTDIQAIGGTSSTPVIKVVCSNTVNSFAKTKSIMLVIDTNTVTDEKGRKIYAPGQDIYLYNGSRTAGVNCYLRGKVGKDGKVVFTVPMVNSYWTVGTKNLGNSLLHKNV